MLENRSANRLPGRSPPQGTWVPLPHKEKVLEHGHRVRKTLPRGTGGRFGVNDQEPLIQKTQQEQERAANRP